MTVEPPRLGRPQNASPRIHPRAAGPAGVASSVDHTWRHTLDKSGGIFHLNQQLHIILLNLHEQLALEGFSFSLLSEDVESPRGPEIRWRPIASRNLCGDLTP